VDQAPALRRLMGLHPGTEIWWDSSPLIIADWLAQQREAWRDRPALLTALLDVTFGSLQGVLRGCTTNPPLALEVFERDRTRWMHWAHDRASSGASPRELAWEVYREILRRGAEQVLPIWEQSGGQRGQICGQVDPRLANDRDAMVLQGIELHATSPNVMVKMPASADGIEGIRVLSSLGISTNATLGFSVSQIIATARAARVGFEQARHSGIDLARTRSMATLMLGRFEDAPTFSEQASAAGMTLSEADRRWAGIAIARRAYRALGQEQAPTKLLLASMRLGPTIDGRQKIWHLEQLAGGNAVLTIFPNILASFMESYVDQPLSASMDDPVPAEVLERLLRLDYFAQAYEPDGIPPVGYASLPGFARTQAAFSSSMEALESALWPLSEEKTP